MKDKLGHMAKPDKARVTAIDLITDVTQNAKLLSDLILGAKFLALSPAERARAQRLATECLRAMERVDRILNAYLQKKPPIRIFNILRLATFELSTGGDAHGVVNDAVTLAAMDKKYSMFKGLVNAVLRKVAKSGREQWPKLRAARIPIWLRRALKDVYGREVISAIERVQSNMPPVDLTPKDPNRAEEIALLVNGEVVLGQSVRLRTPGQISKLNGFDSGDWWVQDAAAALPVRLLGDVHGKTALDLCAAPGGKTLQLAALDADVTAIDISEQRLKRLKQNLQRTGLNAHVKVMDAFALPEGHYDVIVLDAPCSATGTMRRHPDLPYAKDGSEFLSLIELQHKMLRHALWLLAPGGRLLYCTCSLLPDEGEAQVEALIAENKQIKVDLATFQHPHVDPNWAVDGLGLRLRPDYLAEKGGMDGFFVSLLHKKA